jgi:dTDP-glucose 4,6-dehydratase
VDALLLASDSKELFNRFTIGANQEISNINLTKIICNYLDKRLPKARPYFEQVTFVEDRLGHDLRYAIDATHISKDKGFNAKYKLKNGIEETIEWYLANKKWVKEKVESSNG